MQKGRLRGWRRGLFLVLSLLAMTARAQENVAWGKWQTWGEQKDGTFRNPVMPADGQKYWAPSKAVERNGRWYIYPTVNGIMHVGVADSPQGPFRLARGADRFVLPYSPDATLLTEGERGGIDAEVFVDDDGQAYAFWGMRHVARMGEDMMTLSDIQTLNTRRTEYSEGPIFFKRAGIYYYLYTITYLTTTRFPLTT